ncbi:amino acid ABC transporter permease [Thermodesulforhabdus norvegica]|uniref:Amino acid ABC transporter membrane protein 2, PAAT family n=1 Tax=Thermodesulforhabdus norvegica TaxID=39841 RepID=A0A1I4TSF9_9BACT|nr:amino acid ABC transporter permease [Thermodesulforhabdus norvegica]SFM79648.1 amino acid ABC transporter membrane protein 2, PAAT family [Thermodesulforhabdus norvegica]
MTDLAYFYRDVFPALLGGLIMSIKLIVPSAILGLALGVIVGSLRVYGVRPVRIIADGYVALFRGVPLLVQLFTWYFGLPHVGIFLSPYGASVMGFTLCSAAYHSEYVRGALLSIRRGQILAAQALGFTTFEILRSVVLPQALRRALPGCGNEIIYLIKYSSLAYMITCIELTGRAKALASQSFKYLEIFLIVGAIYLALVSVASWILHRVEKALTIPGFDLVRN